MTHQDHVQLIENGISEKGGAWADLGSGTGAFTLALRAIAGESVRIYSVDKDRDSLRIQKDHFNSRFPKSNIQFIATDFHKPIISSCHLWTVYLWPTLFTLYKKKCRF